MIRRGIGVLVFIAATLPLAAQTLVFPDDLVYNDFFAATVTTEDGEAYHLFDVSAIDGDSLPWPDASGGFGEQPGAGPTDVMKYFLWIRRGGAAGVITYPLAFQKIARIAFTGDYGENVPYHLPADLTLTDGNSFSVDIKADGFLGGLDEDFGTYALLWLAHDGLATVNFHNDDGTYSRCSFCGAIFFDDRAEICPFDGTPLFSALEP